MITPRDTASINKHFNELNKLGILSIQEQQNVAKKALSGCSASREVLINSNLRLVLTLAKRYQMKGVAYEDLVSTGNLGLVRAVESFNPEKGNFPSWAYTYITREMGEFLRANGHTVKFPVQAKRSGMEPLNIKYFSEFIPGSEDTYEELLPGSNEQELVNDEVDNNNNLREVLQNNITKLKPIQQQIVQLHYYEGLNYKEIGDRLGKTREGIRRSHAKLIEILKDFLCT